MIGARCLASLVGVVVLHVVTVDNVAVLLVFKDATRIGPVVAAGIIEVLGVVLNMKGHRGACRLLFYACCCQFPS